MAAFTRLNVGQGAWTYTWTLTQGDATGTAVHVSQFSDRSVQVYGTFTTGTVVFEGANETTSPTYATLSDPQGTALSFTSAKIEQVLENTVLARPRATGADGSTSVTVILFVVSQSGDTGYPVS